MHYHYIASHGCITCVYQNKKLLLGIVSTNFSVFQVSLLIVTIIYEDHYVTVLLLHSCLVSSCMQWFVLIYGW